ncbi:serine/threonine-protein kinase dbf2 [Coemansia thaxteri]|uniref:non-specific serine/threonine protein kinase n=1 Tax=Coemansia thaxteri TaxID=2663907 RepID=A0A9W8BF94_9FUNG|nr:serine/threonine-protein kinase dbf2 [Coemansia thaxteri]KAJ2005196.1 serine/threonine-protein kinase dbf2 [Coemansia thaxteri]KAJ2473621.1 serine/threonine-protein kinase dbf2 [Coemansia sp. RSA 2322]KAJ2487959.1 serine/threonine-protein kinase dbf2 [Coemansia sp. RSA 2320]
MADRRTQGTDYDQDRAQMAYGGPDGAMHHMHSGSGAGAHPVQAPPGMQYSHQQQLYYQQQQMLLMQQAGQQYQYAHVVQAPAPAPAHAQAPQQYQQYHQQAAPQQSIHQAMAGQHSPGSQFAPQTANSGSALLAQQMRRMRQSPAGGGLACDGDGREEMSVDAPGAFPRPLGDGAAAGSLTRRNAFLDTIDPAIRRKVEAAQVYFLEYYVDHLQYIANRRRRLEDFKSAIRSVQTTRQHVQDSWSSHCGNESSILRRRRNRTREREFDILAQIGQGGYGQVFLARKRDTGEVCALKKMAKKLLVKLGEVQHILTERDILRTSKSEWLVRLLYSFQDQQSLYLAMEYVPGGDVRTLLNQNGILRHQIARFYIAEMMVAVAALHAFGYFHRDLKPENFLVDAMGHIKLTDFGLSHGHLSRPTLEAMKKKLDRIKDQEIVYHSSSEKRSFYKSMRQEEMPRAYSIVGSPDYMAPEILYTSLVMDQQKKKKKQAPGAETSAHAQLGDAHLGYDFRVDYWSLGCILYEFLSSYAPFTGPSADDVWRNVYHWSKAFHRPEFDSKEAEDNLQPEAWDLITRLVSHRSERLCSVNEAATHPYFRGMALGSLRSTEQPPFVPELQSETDKAYFDDFSNPNDMELYRDVYNKRKELDSLVDSHAPSDAVDPAAFIGFTYRHNRQSRNF